MRLSTIASGSSGNCIYVGSETTHILIDVGISKKKIEAGLEVLNVNPDEIDGIFVTHEHSDHISGIGVMSRAYERPIYATQGTSRGISEYKSLGKMPDGLNKIITANTVVKIGDLEIEAFHISHDANEPTGFIIKNNEHKVAVVTDLGMYDDYILEKLKGVHAIFLEANHDEHMVEVGNYPYSLKRRVLGEKGHLSNELSGRLLCDIIHDNLSHVVLSHISRENNYEELAFETIKLELLMNPVPFTADDINIIIANRDGVKDVIQL